MDTQTFWNEVGSTKDFEDPLYLDKLEPFLSSTAKIVEYGCGYGRLLQLLQSSGYTGLVGFDFAPNMITRGHQLHPSLHLSLASESGAVPLGKGRADCVILSTTLCCIVDEAEQEALIREMQRILKPGGVLYLSDFLICKRYADRYDQGVYTTSEGGRVRHHTTQWIMHLLSAFDIQWFEQFDFVTMNHNPARTFHCIAKQQITASSS